MSIKRGIIVLILSLFSLPVQSQKVNYARKDVSLVKLFKEIRKQTGINVIWNEKEFSVNQKIDADFRGLELKSVMDQISKKLPLSYTIFGNMIVVKLRPVVQVPAEIRKQTPPKNKILVVDTLKEFDLKEVAVVNTGYQRIPKERATGSFVIVDSVQLNRKVSLDIFSRLEGITSGLLFNKNTLNANSGNLDLSIRGRSTIYANDQPLIILDDFPYNGDLSSINPNEISNVTLLKDAAAASIWGVRAGNGVIVITTKKGRYKQPLTLSFNSNLSVAGKPDVFYNPNYLPSSDFIDLETFLFNNGKYDAAIADKVNYPVISPAVKILDRQRKGQASSITEAQLNDLRDNDYRNEELKYFYRNSMLQQYFFNAAKGTDKSNHSFSVGYDHADLNLVNNSDDRLTLNTRHSVKLLKNLELTAGISYVRNTAKIDSAIFNISGRGFTPYYQFKDANGQPVPFEINSADFNAVNLAKGFLDWSYFPLDELAQPPLNLIVNDLRINGALKYHILPALAAELKYQHQQINNSANIIQGVEEYNTRVMINQYSQLTGGRVTGYNIPLGAIQSITSRKALAKNLRGQLNYQKQWRKHALSAIAGYEIAEFDTQMDRVFRYGINAKTGHSATVDTATTFNLYPSGTGKIVAYNNLFGRLDRIRSVFANAAYRYDQKYVFSLSARMDGSNYFGVKTNQKNVPLWSAGVLWNLDQEHFYKINWLPNLKLSASHGYNGNLDKRNTGVTTFRNNALGAGFTNLPFANISNVGNPELRWEKIAITNFGLDFGFKDQIVTGKIEYYLKNGTDIIGDKAFPSNTGISKLRGNYSEMKASGIDLSFNSRNLNGIVKWQTSYLFSKVKDKVSLYDVLEQNNTYYVSEYNNRPVLDRPIFGLYGYKWAGLDPINGDPRGYLDGEISKDYNRILNESSIHDLEYIGPARPTLFGGISNLISYRKFTFGFNVSYKFGYYFRKRSINYYDLYHSNLYSSIHMDFTRRWKKSGDENSTDVPSMSPININGSRDRFYNGSSATVAKGDHIRLQDISLSFDFDRSNWRNIPVKNMQIYVYANNLGIIWKANDFGLDPDFLPNSSNRIVRPLPRSFSIGVKAGF